MTTETTPTPSGGSSLVGLFATGFLAMLVCWLVLLGLSYPIAKPESLPVAMMWAISHGWVAFLVGAVALIAKARLSRQRPGAALTAYLFPGVLVAAIAGALIAIYPDPDFRSQLLDMLPLTLAFYLFGLIWLTFAKSGDQKSSMMRAIIPPTAGGLVIAGMIALPVFQGNPFIYRNAFSFGVSKVAIENGQMIADGTVEIHKPGDYEFSAPRFSYVVVEGSSDFDSMIENGQITWGAAGPPKSGSTGSHPFQVRWQKNIPANIEHLRSGMSEESSIFMEVHQSGTERGELLFNLSAPIP